MIAQKRKLCYTEVSDFTNIQGVGNDPIYKRYSSVYAVIKQSVNPEYHSFLAEPEYSSQDDRIVWYADEWDYTTTPMLLMNLEPAQYNIYKSKLDETVAHYRKVIASLTGQNKAILESALKFVDERFVYCIGDKVVLALWGMQPDEFRLNPNGVIIHAFDLQDSSKVIFNPGEHGALKSQHEGNGRRRNGSVLSSKDLPVIIPDEGYQFVAWEPDPIGVEVTGDLCFTAKYQRIAACNVTFEGDDNCKIDGVNLVNVDCGAVLSDNQIPGVVADDGYVFDRWDFDITQPITNDIVIKALSKIDESQICYVKFAPDDYCSLNGDLEFDIRKGKKIPFDKIPEVVCHPGYEFVRWSEDVSAPVDENKFIRAECKPEESVTVFFNGGVGGEIVGNSFIKLPLGSQLMNHQVPQVSVKPGYNFIGWDKSPLDVCYDQDTTINAVYEEQLSWWRRLWRWLTSLSGCLLPLLGFLLLLLLLLYLLSLLRGCEPERTFDHDDIENGPALIDERDTVDYGFDEIPGYADDGRIGDVPSTPIEDEDLGVGIDPGNGGGDYHIGILPTDPEVLPIPNPENPDGPQIIPNVINVFFNDDNANLNAFAQDFRELYPDTEKYLLDYDDLVKRVSIMMPSEERVQMKEDLQRQLGNKYSFFIVDEVALANDRVASVLGSVGVSASAEYGWHLLAINAPEAWTITMGDPEVIVAVVDDGCDLEHDMFAGKIVAPYNVFTKNGVLEYGSGHGTHTAGLAVGYTRPDGKASGVAPNCKLMPIQVFDGEMCLTSSMVSGIAYAIHNGADVVNISIGPDMSHLRGISDDEQISLSRGMDRSDELLWNRVLDMAERHNTILVFSAGNDNVVSYVNAQNRPDKIISVTAVDANLDKSLWDAGSGSNYGLGSTIAAPGSDIYSTMPINDFDVMSGTSMAAPIVAGTIALLKSVNRDVTISQAIDILTQSGMALSDSSLGPLVQADRALILLRDGSLPPTGRDDRPVEQPADQPEESVADYSDIFRQISEHQRAISDLVDMLPPDERAQFR